MQYYLIQDTIVPCAPEDCSGTDGGMIIAVMNSEEWKSERERLGMRIEFDPTTRDIHSTKVETASWAGNTSSLLPWTSGGSSSSTSTTWSEK